MYVFFNNNPKGLKIGDCVVRAISAALNQPWERTYIDLCIEGFMFHDLPNANAVWASYLRSKGFVRRSLPDNCPDCFNRERAAEQGMSLNSYINKLLDDDLNNNEESPV